MGGVRSEHIVVGDDSLLFRMVERHFGPMMVCNVKMTKDVAIGKNAGVVDDISVLRVFADGGMSLPENVASGFQGGQFKAVVFRDFLHCFDVVG